MTSFWDKLRNRSNKDETEDEARSFKAEQQKEAAYESVSRGVRAVPVDRIVGSVGRYHDLDNQFRLKRHVPSDRLKTIKRLMREGQPLPPVKLYEIKDEFYALDGNHRIAVAKEFGHSEINAQIVEFLPSKKTLENVLYLQKTAFEDKTGLQDRILLSEIGQYDRLLDQIESHWQYLQKETPDQEVAYQDAARDWYDTIYTPLTAIIERGNLLASFPERTLGDLYAYISYHQWERGRAQQYGIGVNRLVPMDMEAFREKMAEKDACEYPDMLREITAFVLLNVEAKREKRLFERLAELEGVKELHAVHGSIDMVVKIVLQRDLLSSDAEVIGDYVHGKIRRIPGIVSSQTLIPSSSRIK